MVIKLEDALPSVVQTLQSRYLDSRTSEMLEEVQETIGDSKTAIPAVLEAFDIDKAVSVGDVLDGLRVTAAQSFKTLRHTLLVVVKGNEALASLFPVCALGEHGNMFAGFLSAMENVTCMADTAGVTCIAELNGKHAIYTEARARYAWDCRAYIVDDGTMCAIPASNKKILQNFTGNWSK